MFLNTVTPYNPERKISLSAMLKLELHADIQVLTQLHTQRKLGLLMERAGFSQSQIPLRLYYNVMSPAVNCLRSWVDEEKPTLEATWRNFLQILQELEMNLGKMAGQIENYLQVAEQETELSSEFSVLLFMDGHEYDCYYKGMEELDVLGFQIESLQHLFTTTSKDEMLLLKLESFHKRYH